MEILEKRRNLLKKKITGDRAVCRTASSPPVWASPFHLFGYVVLDRPYKAMILLIFLKFIYFKVKSVKASDLIIR